MKKCDKHEIFDTGNLTKPDFLYLELYLPQNDSVLLFYYHWPQLKPWLTLTDLGYFPSIFSKSARSKSFLRKPYLKIMTPKLFYYGCATPSQSVQKDTLKNRVREFCTSRFFGFFCCCCFLFPKMRILITWGLKNLRLTKQNTRKMCGRRKIHNMW